MKRLAQATFALLLLAIGSGALSAQQRIQESVDVLRADDPRARRATELLEPTLRGDLAAAEAYLKEHAAPEYGQEEDMVPLSSIARQFAGYTLEEVVQGVRGGDELMVQVRKGDERRAVVVRIGQDAPYRIVGFPNARVRIQVGGPGALPRRPRGE